MHLVEHYALTCGSFIRKPFILEKFYPLDCGKYITFQSDTKSDSRNYDYWSEVISLIYPYLQKENIQIVQVGGKDERVFPKTIRTNGKTSTNQLAYIVKNSILHFGPDSFAVHLASTFGKKIVGIYSYCYASQCGPYFSNPEDVVLIEPDRNGDKPSYSHSEDPKTVNTIKPEEIAKSILGLLGISYEIKNTTVYIGQDYKNKSFNIIPNSIIDPSRLGINGVPTVRMDLEFDQENLFKQLSVCKCNIITNKPIHPEIIKQKKANISSVAYKIEKDHNVNFIKYLKANNISYALLSELPEHEVNDIKLIYLDYGIIIPIRKKVKADFDFSNIDNLKYVSSKSFFSNGKFYDSIAAWKTDRDNPVLFSSQPEDIIDIDDFWEQAESFYFLTS